MERPSWIRRLLGNRLTCAIGFHEVEPIENGLKYRCVHCGTWDFWDDWI